MAMSTLTIRLPDDTAQRLKSLAQSRGLSMNKLVEQLSAHALSAWDTENHFRAMAATGDVPTALAVLDRLDAADSALQASGQQQHVATGPNGQDIG
jgi:predicted transcriptional regulator